MTEEELARAMYLHLLRAFDPRYSWIGAGTDLSKVRVDGHADLIALARAVLEIVGKETGK